MSEKVYLKQTPAIHRPCNEVAVRVKGDWHCKDCGEIPTQEVMPGVWEAWVRGTEFSSIDYYLLHITKINAGTAWVAEIPQGNAAAIRNPKGWELALKKDEKGIYVELD